LLLFAKIIFHIVFTGGNAVGDIFKNLEEEHK